MKLPRLLAAVVAATVAAGTLAACGSSEPRSLLRSIEGGDVILGTKFDQPGLGLRHPDKSMSGVDVDVARYVVEYIATKNDWDVPAITWRETPSPQRETMIRNGEVDMITATYSINDKREKVVDYAGPYLITEQALLVRADDDSITSLTDLDKGKKLCSVSGSTPAQNVKAQLPGVQLQEFDTYSSCVEALHQKKVDALTTDASILAGFSQLYEGEFQLIRMALVKDDPAKKKKAGDAFSIEYYGIGHTEGDDASDAAVDEALAEMISSGAWTKIIEKNLGKAVTAGDSPLLCAPVTARELAANGPTALAKTRAAKRTCSTIGEEA